MHKTRYFRAISFALILGLPFGVYADDLEDRVERLERMSNSKVLLELSNQLQQLQNEIRQLRGQVEQSSRELAQLKRLQQEQNAEIQQRQKELFSDLDRRMYKLEVGDIRASTDPIHRDGTETDVETTDNRQLEHNDTTSTGSSIPTRAIQHAGVTTNAPHPDARTIAHAGNTSGGSNIETEVSSYKAAFDLLKDGRYQQAVDEFRSFLQRYPNGVYADNSQYWLGEANYVIRNFDVALTEFRKVIDNFPKSPKAADATLKIGYIYYEKGDWKAARETLESVRQKYPRANAVGLAEKRLDRMRREGH